MLSTANWRNAFDENTLKNGKYYFESGAVGEITPLDKNYDEYNCIVQGTDKYLVDLKRKNGSIFIGCTCPYAEKGHFCKHEAAAFFAIEHYEEMQIAEDKPAKKKRQPLFDKTEKQANDYSYFDVPYISQKVIVSEENVKKARALSDAFFNSLYNTSVENDHYTNQKVFYASAEAAGSPSFVVNLKISPEKIVSLDCYCKRCSRSRHYYYYNYEFDYKKELCENQAAMLLAVKKYIDINNPGDISDYNLDRLFRAFENDNIIEGEASIISDGDEDNIKHTLELSPRISTAKNGLMTSYKIDNGKKYIIRSIPQFVEAVENHGTMTLGSKRSVDFSKEGFTEASEKLYNIIRDTYKESSARISAREAMYDYRNIEAPIKDSILLVGNQLDLFFDLFENKLVEYNGFDKYSRNGFIKFLNEEYMPTLTIDSVVDDRGAFHGIKVFGVLPSMTMGSKYGYMEKDDAFCRISEDSMRKVNQLKRLASNNDLINLRVGRKKLAEFYYSVLPNLKKYATINDICHVDVTQFLPNDAEFKFFVDSENNDITCRIETYYGDKKYDLTPDPKNNQSNLALERNMGKETAVLAAARKLFPYPTTDNKALCCGADENQMYNVVESGLATLMQIGEVMVTERFKKLSVKRVPPVSFGVKVENNLLELSIATEDLSRDELLQLIDSYKKHRKYFRLQNGDLIKTDDNTLKELSAVMDAMHISTKDFLRDNMKMPLYRALYLDKLLEGNGAVYADRDKHFKELVRNFKTVDDADYEPPASLKNTLRSYQTYGYKWLNTVAASGFGGILADDMGLGKTLQVISMLTGEKERATANPPLSIVITPASLVYNWAEEFKKYAPSINHCVVAGTLGERKKLIANHENVDVLITSYDLLKRDIAEYEGISFDYEIIDEAQFIKNHGTAAAKSVKAINSKVRFALTGTPIENRLSELWSIFDYLMPGFLYGYDIFKKELETPIAKTHNEEITDRLKKMVSPFILRRLKSDVLKDLPEKLEEVQTAVLDTEQRHIYDAEVIKIQDLLNNESEEDFAKKKIQLLAELTRIRQICCDPSLLYSDYKGGSAKLDAAIDLIKSAIEGEHRILLFSQFTSMLAILQAKLQEEGIDYYLITGDTPKPERLELVNKFNSDNTPVFLISLKAGGTGLNLTGADVVIHYDPWWNVAAQNQATDRAHRIGQTKVVTVYKLIAKDTIEEKILAMQKNKQDLADAILSGDMGGLMNMSREELLELVGM